MKCGRRREVVPERMFWRFGGAKRETGREEGERGGKRGEEERGKGGRGLKKIMRR